LHGSFVLTAFCRFVAAAIIFESREHGNTTKETKGQRSTQIQMPEIASLSGAHQNIEAPGVFGGAVI
jgi:hypothetical protein